MSRDAGAIREVIVRRAIPVDADAIRQVNERAIRISAREFYTPAQIEAWAGPICRERALWMIENTIVCAATAGEHVVGFANLVVEDREVDQLYVDPGAGGRGVARVLYYSIESHALAIGLDRLHTTASLRAAPAFERFGFVEIARAERAFNGESFPVVSMAKQLR